MPNRIFFLLFLAISFSTSTFSQSFIYEDGDSQNDLVNDVVEGPLNDLYLSAYVVLDDDPSQLYYDGFIIRLDSLGNKISETFFAKHEVLASISKVLILKDSSVLIIFCKDYIGELDFYLINYTSDLQNVNWTRRIGRSGLRENVTDVQVFEEKIVVFGAAHYSLSPPLFFDELFVYELDLEGNILNQAYHTVLDSTGVTYHTGGYGNSIDADPLGNGYFIVGAGLPDSSPSAISHNEVLHIDSNLNWKAIQYLTFGGLFGGTGRFINDTSLLVCSSYPNFSPPLAQNPWDDEDLVLAWINTGSNLGYEVQRQYIGIEDTFDRIAYQPLDFVHKNAIYLGSTARGGLSNLYYGHYQNYFVLAKLDSLRARAGVTLWQKKYGGDAFYFMVKVLATRDGGAVMIGSRYDYREKEKEERDIIVIKVDGDGNVLTNSLIEINKFPARMGAFPNPTKDWIYFHFDENVRFPIRLSMSNQLGQAVLTDLLAEGQGVSLKDLPSGFYYLSARDAKDHVFNQKIVKE